MVFIERILDTRFNQNICPLISPINSTNEIFITKNIPWAIMVCFLVKVKTAASIPFHLLANDLDAISSGEFNKEKFFEFLQNEFNKIKTPEIESISVIPKFYTWDKNTARNLQIFLSVKLRGKPSQKLIVDIPLKEGVEEYDIRADYGVAVAEIATQPVRQAIEDAIYSYINLRTNHVIKMGVSQYTSKKLLRRIQEKNVGSVVQKKDIGAKKQITVNVSPQYIARIQKRSKGGRVL